MLYFDGGQVRVTLGSPTPGIEVRVASRGVVVRGFMRPADVGLFATRPVLFEEIAVRTEPQHIDVARLGELVVSVKKSCVKRGAGPLR